MKFTIVPATALILASSIASAQTMPGEALLLLDVNGDGTVTQEEYTGQMDTLFGGIDTNQNGRLERGETESFISEELFTGTDTNANGSLSKSEFDTQIQKDFATADTDSDGDLD